MKRTGKRGSGRRARTALLGMGLAVAGCSAVPNVINPMAGGARIPEGQPGHVTGFLGAVVADEPQAALVGRQALSAGGDAADAAVAVASTLAVTLPSRAGLGGGGACLAYDPARNNGVPAAITFVPLATPTPPPSSAADRPAAVPMMLRGLYLLHADYGHLPFEQLLEPAENLARSGARASRAFADDLRLVAGPLLADPQARAVFAPNGHPVKAGESFVQPALAGTLGQVRAAGVGDFYLGGLAQLIVQDSPLAGGPLTLRELHDALPTEAAPIELPDGRGVTVAFLPPPADGGLAAAAAFQVLQANPQAVQQAEARAEAIAARWRATGGSPQALLAAQLPPGSLPSLGATTTFVTMDPHGGAVACALTMDNLFGTGRLVPGLGFLLAASPRTVPPPLLAAAVAYRRQRPRKFIAAIGGSGQNAAALAAAEAMANALRSRTPMPQPVNDPGRANVIVCPVGMPGGEASCGWATDPRGGGLALGGGGGR